MSVDHARSKSVMRSALALLVGLLTLGVVINLPASAQSGSVGAFLGAVDTEHPGWFKESFLDFEEDIDEAAAGGPRQGVNIWQAGC
ncbi:MAG: hypothetical protein L7T80_09070, partial [Arenicellales bacterium]|nr:hypothetical protein [Arenicellales bacterium]